MPVPFPITGNPGRDREGRGITWPIRSDLELARQLAAIGDGTLGHEHRLACALLRAYGEEPYTYRGDDLFPEVAP